MGGVWNVEGAGLLAAVFCTAVNPLKYGSFGKYGCVTADECRRAPAGPTLRTPAWARQRALHARGFLRCDGEHAHHDARVREIEFADEARPRASARAPRFAPSSARRSSYRRSRRSARSPPGKPRVSGGSPPRHMRCRPYAASCRGRGIARRARECNVRGRDRRRRRRARRAAPAAAAGEYEGSQGKPR